MNTSHQIDHNPVDYLASRLVERPSKGEGTRCNTEWELSEIELHRAQTAGMVAALLCAMGKDFEDEDQGYKRNETS